MLVLLLLWLLVGRRALGLRRVHGCLRRRLVECLGLLLRRGVQRATVERRLDMSRIRRRVRRLGHDGGVVREGVGGEGVEGRWDDVRHGELVVLG